MFDYSYNFTLPCQECTAEEFEKLVTSDKVRRAIAKARECEAAIRQLGDDADEMRKQLEAEKAKAKRTLPCIMFQATFDANTEGESPSDPTQKRWRNNKNARLNGLFIVDIDHVDNPDLMWQENMDVIKRLGIEDRLMLGFMTASGHGLKYVLKADAAIGDIAANQEWFCKSLCIECDKACKDAARISYCPSKEDILFINSEIFEYNNEDYDRQFGGKYRDPNGSAKAAAGTAVGCAKSEGGTPAFPEASAKSTDGRTVPTATDGGGIFHGVPFARIVEEYTKLYRKEDWTEDGVPQPGERHQFVHRMARDLRYLCDMDKAMLVKMLHTSPTCRFIEGRDAKEFERIVDAALSYKTICGYPQSVRMACKNSGVELPYFGSGEIADDQDEIDYDFWASRILPLLHPDNPRDIYARAVAKMDDKLKLGGVLVAGAMTGTYLTQCYFQHYDARLYRLSYLVYVIGPPASGKSFLADLDKVLMYAMKQQDETFRKTEREYADKKERNEQMKGAKEKDIATKPHLPIRYVPSTISNKVLYNRLTDAVTSDSPDAMHLHLFTTETELATALRVQVGSWAGKLDLELKSFQNEWAGVDYADNGSANGLIQVNWNQCISSTQSSVLKKVRGGDLDDGFITRLALWLMPPTKGKMIDYKGDQPVEFDDIRLAPEDMDIVKMCLELSELSGRIDCEPLVRAAWEWCDNQTDLAKLDNDDCREYFRKRIPLYMIRYTLPRMVCMQYEEFKKTGKLVVTEEDKEFARVIGDWLMFASIRQWGNKLMTTWESKAEENKVREKSSPFADRYANLPETFSLENISAFYLNKKSAQSAIATMIKKGIVAKVGKNQWKKLKANIYDTSVFS